MDNVGSNGISYHISELFPCIFYVPDKSFMVNNVVACVAGAI